MRREPLPNAGSLLHSASTTECTPQGIHMRTPPPRLEATTHHYKRLPQPKYNHPPYNKASVNTAATIHQTGYGTDTSVSRPPCIPSSVLDANRGRRRVGHNHQQGTDQPGRFPAVGRIPSETGPNDQARECLREYGSLNPRLCSARRAVWRAALSRCSRLAAASKARQPSTVLPKCAAPA